MNAGKNVASIFFSFWRIPCRRRVHFAFDSSWSERGGTQERSNANRRRRNKSLQNSDQIQICRRLLFIIVIAISVASFREIDFALFFLLPVRSVPFVQSRSVQFYQQDQTDTNHSSCFSWIILLWIYWCVAFEFSVRVRFALTARVWFLTYLFWLILFELHWTEPVNVNAGSYSKLYGRASGRRHLLRFVCHVNRQFWRIINSVVAFKKHSTNEKKKHEKQNERRTKTEMK